MKSFNISTTFILLNIIFIVSAHVITSINIDGDEKSVIYDSIDEFKWKNPDVELIPMDIVGNSLDVSRSYTLGARQTGEMNFFSAKVK